MKMLNRLFRSQAMSGALSLMVICASGSLLFACADKGSTTTTAAPNLACISTDLVCQVDIAKALYVSVNKSITAASKAGALSAATVQQAATISKHVHDVLVEADAAVKSPDIPDDSVPGKLADVNSGLKQLKNIAPAGS